MRPYIKITAVISVALALAGCEQSGSADVDRAIGDLNVIDIMFVKIWYRATAQTF